MHDCIQDLPEGMLMYGLDSDFVSRPILAYVTSKLFPELALANYHIKLSVFYGNCLFS